MNNSVKRRVRKILFQFFFTININVESMQLIQCCVFTRDVRRDFVGLSLSGTIYCMWLFSIRGLFSKKARIVKFHEKCSGWTLLSNWVWQQLELRSQQLHCVPHHWIMIFKKMWCCYVQEPTISEIPIMWYFCLWFPLSRCNWKIRIDNQWKLPLIFHQTWFSCFSSLLHVHVQAQNFYWIPYQNTFTFWNET